MRALQAVLCKLGRRLLAGKACEKTERGGTAKHKALTNKEALVKVGPASVRTELLIGRIKFLQGLTRNTHRHAQYYVAMFSRLPFEVEKDGDHPHLEQFLGDLSALASHDDVHWIVEIVLREPVALFADPDIVDSFRSFGTAWLSS